MDFRQDYDRITVIPSSYQTLQSTPSGTTFAYSILAILLLGYIFNHMNYFVLSFPEFFWNIAVYFIPDSLVQALDNQSNSQTRYQRIGSVETSTLTSVAKIQAMRRILGLVTGPLGSLPTIRSLSVAGATLKAPESNRLPGLGNWDNSCYQNSVIQGLASLPALQDFLDQATSRVEYDGCQTTTEALKSVIAGLNNPSNASKRLWTPEKLKNMSSLQQQDAQEYYSKILNEMEKETAHAISQNLGNVGLLEIKKLTVDSSTDVRPLLKTKSEPGVPSTEKQQDLIRLREELVSNLLKSPLEGLLAQRVGCLQCGFVEGLTMIPFNCLTLPLGREWAYDIRTCLNEYTALEPITGVDCSKCTLLRHKQQLEKLLNKTRAEIEVLDAVAAPKLSDNIRDLAFVRLKAVTKALEEEDFSENTILKKCMIPPKSRISTTKTRQAVVSRHPKSLIMHVNRSVFDELTGESRKSHAGVQFPKTFDLSPWCLGNSPQADTCSVDFMSWTTDPSQSMIPGETYGQGDNQLRSGRVNYSLKAVITHYGRHENGHYICYRKRPQLKSSTEGLKDMDKWWCLSDDDVSEVTDDDVLAQQGGVFMLFYELDEDYDKDDSSGTVNSVSINNTIENPILSEKVELADVENIIESHPAAPKTDDGRLASPDVLLPNPIPSLVSVDPITPSLSLATEESADIRELHPHDSNEGSHKLGLDDTVENLCEGSPSIDVPSGTKVVDVAEHSLIASRITARPGGVGSEKSSAIEDRQLTPWMRTAGSCNNKGSGSIAERAMSSVLLVTAN